MKKSLSLLLVLICINAFGQTEFENGYIIKNNGEKIDCLIRNMGWLNIPKNITYKIEGETKNISAINLKKIEIFDEVIYERHIVEIDKYSNKIQELTKDRKSNFKSESLLLKLLISSNQVALYKYSENNVDYFFYKKEEMVKPLEYKLFKTKSNKIQKNLNYQKTLRDEFSCESKDNNSKIKYKEKNLVNYFKLYFDCNQTNYKDYTKQDKKSKINLRAKLSLGQSTVTNPFNPSSQFDFEKKIAFKLGVELEYVLPFNKNKWSAFIEPTYSSYSSDVPDLNPNANFIIDYQTIELPFGIRHYLF